MIPPFLLNPVIEVSVAADAATLAPIASSTPMPVDWTQYNDSVMLLIERPKGHKIGNTICTAVLIHPRVVLTTAHCVDDAISITVVFDVENGTMASKKVTVLSNNIVKHADYHPKKSLYKNDLAALLLEVAAPLEQKWIRLIPAKTHLKVGDRLNRVGVGLRNGKNSRNVTDPLFAKIPSAGVLETTDVFSYFGDSGGPLYTPAHDLLALHSTIDDLDGKGTPHAYAVYLPHYKVWMQEMIERLK